MDISHLREHYFAVGLSETDLHPDPIEQFAIWFKQVLSADLPVPTVAAGPMTPARELPAAMHVDRPPWGGGATHVPRLRHE